MNIGKQTVLRFLASGKDMADNGLTHPPQASGHEAFKFLEAAHVLFLHHS
jgi:hypothetical protein